MTLEDLGYNPELEKYVKEENLTDFEIGRITKEHKERYIVRTDKNEFEAEITGNLRYAANSRTDYPAVGDWVAIKSYDSNSAIIYNVLPRKSALERQAIGMFGEKQIISSNVDDAFIIQSIEKDFNINRFERYLTICHSAKIKPILILSKIDLFTKEETQNILKKLKSRVKKNTIFLLSNITKEGYNQILSMLEKGKTYCVIGSSGVGKSTLINNLLGRELMKTSSISQATNKGKHTTNHRELIILDNGGILIDTPGMRELGITDDTQGIVSTFDTIIDLTSKCKFNDCTHISEKGCAVVKALNDGDINKATYKNYLKMLKEQKWFQSTVEERRRKDKKFGKMVKSVMKDKKQYK